MSRSIGQIQEEILSLKSATSALQPLDILTDQEQPQAQSGSKVAQWRLMVWVVAVAIWSMEKLFDVFRAEIDRRIAETRPHTKGWYRQKALQFQKGYTLHRKDYYDVVDESAKIIKYASVRKLILSGRGTLLIKVVKADGDNLTPLTASERLSFAAYMDEVADLGTFIKVVSLPADKLVIEADVYYDPQLIDANGNYIKTGSPVLVPAIAAYLRSMDFDSRLILTKLTDAIQSAKGIYYPVLKKVKTTPYGGVENVVLDLAGGIHQEFTEPASGWYQLDQTAIQINYLPLNES